MSLGLKRGMVTLEPHDKSWKKEAEKTIGILKNILGKAAVDIQHVGSTAITAISAKPIIDIAVGVNDLEQILRHNDGLEQKGIYYRGSDVDNQLLYVMGDFDKDIRTHHIHVVIWNGIEWNNYLNFRDFLNCNIDIALRYEQFKTELGNKYLNDRGAYTQGKPIIIDNILEQARQWRDSCK